MCECRRPEGGAGEPAAAAPGKRAGASRTPAKKAMGQGVEGCGSKDADYVRPAGRKEMDLPPSKWTKTDEEADESFPASDPPGNYLGKAPGPEEARAQSGWRPRGTFLPARRLVCCGR